jgi:hypothetical protein
MICKNYAQQKSFLFRHTKMWFQYLCNHFLTNNVSPIVFHAVDFTTFAHSIFSLEKCDICKPAETLMGSGQNVQECDATEAKSGYVVRYKILQNF